MFARTICLLALFASSSLLAAESNTAYEKAATSNPAASNAAPSTPAANDAVSGNSAPANTPAKLAHGNAEHGKELSQPCVACHSADGNSVNPIWPKLAAQHTQYIVTQLKNFKLGPKGPRNVPLMYAQAMNLSDQDMQDLAAYFASQQITPGAVKADKLELGEKIYRDGNLQTGVSACMACHEYDGLGNGPALFPRVAAQHEEYLAQQLRNYKSGTRVASKMNAITKRMTDEEIDAVASYMAGQKTGNEKKMPGAENMAANNTASPAAKPAAQVSGGQKTYEAYCVACHGAGVAGAPKFGDKAAWAPRIAQGRDTLVSHAIKGIRAMPAKGTCIDCSDADIGEVVDYMLKAAK